MSDIKKCWILKHDQKYTSVEVISLNKVSVDELPINEMSVDKMSIDKTSVEKNVCRQNDCRQNVCGQNVPRMKYCIQDAMLPLRTTLINTILYQSKQFKTHSHKPASKVVYFVTLATSPNKCKIDNCELFCRRINTETKHFWVLKIARLAWPELRKSLKILHAGKSGQRHWA